MEQHPTVRSRGERHTIPSKDADVAKLLTFAVEGKWFHQEDGRTFESAADRAPDITTEGVSFLMDGGFERWWSSRDYKRSEEEYWPADQAQAA